MHDMQRAVLKRLRATKEACEKEDFRSDPERLATEHDWMMETISVLLDVAIGD